MNTPVSGAPRVLLRLEGLVVLIGAVIGFAALDGSWLVFALFILVPDIGLSGYLVGPRVGALSYNALHTYVGPAALALLAYAGIAPSAWSFCLIWMAHIGMDRTLGLGLKFASAFGDTHLGRVGAVATAA